LGRGTKSVSSRDKKTYIAAQRNSCSQEKSARGLSCLGKAKVKLKNGFENLGGRWHIRCTPRGHYEKSKP
jgi:hypothetical protein